MKKIIPVLLAAVIGSAVAGDAAKPAIIFDMGGKFDKSFNQSAYEGAERFKKATGIKYNELEVTNEGQREQFQRKLAQRKNNPIVVTGFAQAPPLAKTAKAFPATNFVIVDAVVEAPNVRSIVFREQEGSFLVGALAAMKSKSGVIGFVGGMDIPLINKFGCGYVQGAKYINPNIKVIQNMTGSTPEAWNNPTKGGELTKAQVDNKADVIYAAAGNTGNGVYQAAKDAGVYAIGVDSNQNHLHPGTMLTSMVKRVDVAVEKAFKDGASGEKFATGVQSLGLKENGVDWALDKYNRDLVTAEMEAKIKDIRAAIIKGDIKVHDYSTDNQCPVK
ncbi:MAG: BMP family ABC transporter substrate-binding protein [Gammaproteobacteria bacterium]|nr:MAG: BMP family ABC transporter substrate-binding protein [Gammaproteobacteria bacterium]